MKSGEWMRYTINVLSNGIYTVEARVASTNVGGRFYVQFEGDKKTAQFTIPQTGSGQNWVTLRYYGVTLSAGQQRIKITVDYHASGTDFAGNLNYLLIRPSQQAFLLSPDDLVLRFAQVNGKNQVRWWGRLGCNYHLESTPRLVPPLWEPFYEIIHGSDAEVVVPITPLAISHFIRWRIEEQIYYDFGDLPTPYPTRRVEEGARHLVHPRICLGTDVDEESDGWPDAGARGDDLNGRDDEDGALFGTKLVPGAEAQVTVTVTIASPQTGFLNGWIDFNQDGDWEDGGEQIFTDMSLGMGMHPLTFLVASNAVPGVAAARFRFSTQEGLSYTGPAPDGEVEDYRVEIERPQPSIDLEKLTNGDDADLPPGPELTVGQEVVWTYRVINNGNVPLYNIVVTDDQGLIVTCPKNTLAPGESMDGTASGTAVAGAYKNTGTVTAVTATGQAVSDSDPSHYTGQAETLDFGDAPAGYPILLAQNGARHRVLVRVKMGQLIDGEVDGKPSADATGDDLAGSPDEDGVRFLDPWTIGHAAKLEIWVSVDGYVSAWADWTRDKDWKDAGEEMIANQPVTGRQWTPFDVKLPIRIETGTCPVRFRYSTKGGLSSEGRAEDGEVEDYLVEIQKAGGITGTKFNDWDGDGERDPGEPGLAGWEIFLDQNGNGVKDAGEPVTTTDTGGFYAFAGLLPGSYWVGEVPQAGWVQSGPNFSEDMELISRTPSNQEPDGWSGRPSISADGRYVAFYSHASDLASETQGFPNIMNVFLRSSVSDAFDNGYFAYVPPGQAAEVYFGNRQQGSSKRPWQLIQTIPFARGAGAHFNPVDGNLLVGRRWTNGINYQDGLYRVDAQGEVSNVASGDRIAAVVVDPVGAQAFFSEDYSGNIYRVKLGTWERSLWVSGFHTDDDDPVGMALVPADYCGGLARPGDVVVVDRGSAGLDEIWRFSSQSSEGETVIHRDAGILQDPVDVVVWRDQLYLVDGGMSAAGAIYRVLSGGALEKLQTSEPLAEPVGITVDPIYGNLLVLDQVQKKLWEVNIETGQITNALPEFTGSFVYPSWAGVDITPDGRRLVITDYSAGKLYLFAREFDPNHPPPDTFPPRVVGLYPEAGAKVPQTNYVMALSAIFDEPISLTGLGPNSLQLQSAGPDRIAGNQDDVLIPVVGIHYEETNRRLVWQLGSALVEGDYRAVLSAPVADPAGNALSTGFAWEFRVFDEVFGQWHLLAGLSFDKPMSAHYNVFDHALYVGRGGYQPGWWQAVPDRLWWQHHLGVPARQTGMMGGYCLTWR